MSSPSPTPSATTPGSAMRRVVPLLVRDVGVPYVAYLALHSAGWSNVAALAAGAAVFAALVVLGMARERRPNALGLVVFATLILAIVVTLITGNARVALARDAVVAGGLGAVFLGSLLVGKPLMYHLAQAMSPDTRLAARWAGSAGFRSTMRVVSLVWGLGLLADAGIRVGLALSLPVPAAATAISALTFVTVLGLVAWMLWYVRRRPGTELAG